MTEERFEVFSSLISSVYGSIQKIKAGYTQELELKSVHIFWLYLLRMHPEGMSASEIARAGKTNRSLVSREIDDLTARGVARVLSRGDHRRYGWKFVLTKEGKELADHIARIALNVQGTINAGINEEELLTFYSVLERIADKLEVLTQGEKEI